MNTFSMWGGGVPFTYNCRDAYAYGHNTNSIFYAKLSSKVHNICHRVDLDEFGFMEISSSISMDQNFRTDLPELVNYGEWWG